MFRDQVFSLTSEKTILSQQMSTKELEFNKALETERQKGIAAAQELSRIKSRQLLAFSKNPTGHQGSCSQNFIFY